MSYCINPGCPQPVNPDDAEYCQECGSSLLYDEFLYRAIRPLETPNGRTTNDTRLYEVTADRGGLKVLKVLTNGTSRLVDLFERETQILQQVAHAGIPQFERAFTVVTSNGTKLRCLVMEKIAGQTLEQWLETHSFLAEETALKWFRQLVEVLSVVHRNRFIHQDIKPSNIMRTSNDQLMLIDFSNVPGIVSAGYTPPEQAEGKAVPQSDFFALGRTFVHLLTGRHPIDLPKHAETRRLIWRPDAPQISELFADLIDDLMAPLPQDRPQTAQIILARLDEIARNRVPATGSLASPEPIPGRFRLARNLNKGLLSTTLLSTGLVMALLYILYSSVRSRAPIALPTSSPTSELACQSALEDYLSCGEEILFPGEPKPEKQQGVDAFRQGNYQQAIARLEQARQRQMTDPETLIYLNNTRLKAQNAETYTIAAVVPIKTSPDLSTEILRGIAQAQDEINHQKIHGRGLRVLIADDANDLKRATKVAEDLVQRKEILGILGHYTSEMSLQTVNIYQKHQLVLISYGSTSTDLSPYGLQPGHVFFRSVPTTQVTALALTSYLVHQSPDQQKVAVFYNPQSPFSRSLKDQFQISIEASGGEIFGEDLCQTMFNAGDALGQAQKQGATAIALFPDGQVCPLSYPNVQATIRANDRRYPMVASWVFSSSDMLKSVGEYAAGKLVVASPWHQLHSPDSKFIKEFVKGSEILWSKQALWDEGVTGLTATAYDATRALITALAHPSQPNSRVAVQQVLADSNFEAKGATGTIRFLGGDRREPINVLLKVVPSKNCNSYNYSFVPINHTAAKTGILDCR
jgi:ABC-type branched-subunit amino acid transport system substrate-binding protein